MHCHPLKIALAVILGLSALSLLPNRFAVELLDLEFPVPPSVPSATQVDSPARDVWMVACRVSTGEYAGFVDSSTFDGTRWVYTLVLPSMSGSQGSIEVIKPGKAEPDQAKSSKQPTPPKPEPVPASDYFVTRFQCPDGQPAPPNANMTRWNRGRMIRCNPALPLTRNASTGRTLSSPDPCLQPVPVQR